MVKLVSEKINSVDFEDLLIMLEQKNFARNLKNQHFEQKTNNNTLPTLSSSTIPTTTTTSMELDKMTLNTTKQAPNTSQIKNKYQKTHDQDVLYLYDIPNEIPTFKTMSNKTHIVPINNSNLNSPAQTILKQTAFDSPTFGNKLNNSFDSARKETKDVPYNNTRDYNNTYKNNTLDNNNNIHKGTNNANKNDKNIVLPSIKCLLIGDKAIGKTTLIKTYSGFLLAICFLLLFMYLTVFFHVINIIILVISHN